MANIINFGGGKASGGGSYVISAPIMGVDFTWDGGDNTCQVIDEGSGNWQMRFLSSGNLKFLSNRLVDGFLVGGGGRGQASYSGTNNRYEARAGGGGYTTTVKSVVLVAETVYPIVVGAGATSATAQAGTSSAFGASAAGGFSGGSDHYGKGGSGGAGHLTSGSSGSMQEFAGGVDGANGGGATYNGVGQGTTTRAFGEADGDLYASGGDAVTRGVGSITAPSPNTGDGGSAAARSSPVQYSGASGIVIIRNHREEAAA
nr:MAG TPA: hypothetical protein [Caudoviricetes sp.]